jgi:hypothetical protein
VGFQLRPDWPRSALREKAAFGATDDGTSFRPSFFSIQDIAFTFLVIFFGEHPTHHLNRLLSGPMGMFLSYLI